MVRFFGWDHAGIPVREMSKYLDSDKSVAALMEEHVLVARGGRSVVYDDVVGLALAVAVASRTHELELSQLLDWSIQNVVDPNEWPAGVIMRRLSSALLRSQPSAEDKEDLLLLLADLAGRTALESVPASPIPFSNPVPPVHFAGREFVFTGHFLYGKSACTDELWSRGATFAADVTSRTDYVVVGSIQSALWRSTPVAGVVADALAESARRPPGAAPVAIISESSWYKAAREWAAVPPRAKVAVGAAP